MRRFGLYVELVADSQSVGPASPTGPNVLFERLEAFADIKAIARE